ncbi:MAG: Mrp/NBP35 family ATP-binding protein [Deltaproteobacteria bacterium]|nr:Mrp/NBP35 family ATP-binding protein [Deltaproteobacteria bacterium]
MSENTKCSSDASCGTCGSATGCEAAAKAKHTEQKLVSRLSKIKYRVAVMSGKGGVGKSTVAVNLAVALARSGKSVGLLDADVHGPNVPKMLGIDHMVPSMGINGMSPVVASDNLKVISMAFLIEDPDTPVVWRGPMKHSLFQQFLSDVEWGTLDYLIVDLPPGTGDEPLSIAQLLGQPLWAIIVTTPQDVALLDSRKSVVFARTVDMKILGIVENMSGLICPHCGGSIDLFKTGGGARSATELAAPFLGAIPIDPQIVTNGDAGVTIDTADPDGTSAEAFRKLANQVELATSRVLDN